MPCTYGQRQRHVRIKKLSISNAYIIKTSFFQNHMLNASCKERMNPLAYFSTAFQFPAILLSTMFDSGYYKEFIADMVNALSICGVTWDLYGQDILDELQKTGTAIISRRRLMALSTWAQEKTTCWESNCALSRQFSMDINTNDVKSDSFTIQIQPNGRIDIIPNSGALNFQDHLDEDATIKLFNILHGTISTSRGIEKVHVIIGPPFTGIINHIKSFYNSHLQCFIRGWCAAHMYYQQAIMNQSIARGSSSRTHSAFSNKRIIKQQQNKSYTFIKANTPGTRSRNFGDSKSLFLDYGNLYYSFISRQNYKVLDLWLADRRKNIQCINWVEGHGTILGISNSWDECYRDSQTTLMGYLTELPEHHRRRLANIVTLDAKNTDAMRSKGFQSSVGRNVMRQGWQMIVLARSGTVSSTYLQDATPWSWVL
ncbi:hypothetical protein V8C35DRAFT_323377 [Trichoderma chlorosporum]